MRIRPALGAVLAGAVVLGLAGSAAAHVSVQPTEAARGSVVDLRFTVPNERDDSATVEIAIQLPGGLETVEPRSTGAWTGEVDGDVVRWTGGRLTGGERVELTLLLGPLPNGERLVLPAVQTYDDGEVVRWIDEGAGSDHPAPALTLTGEPVATTTTMVTTTTEPTTTTAELDGAEAEDEVAVEDDGDDDEGVPVLPLVAAGVVVLLAAGAYALARRGRP